MGLTYSLGIVEESFMRVVQAHSQPWNRSNPPHTFNKREVVDDD
jgi:hypothetical protein